MRRYTFAETRLKRIALALGFCSLSFAPALAQLSSPAAPLQPSSPTVQATDPGLNDRLHLPVPKSASLPNLWLVGDSTVRNGHGDGANGQWGWGDEIGIYFDQSRINVINRAIGGRSSRTYITEGHWLDVLNMIKHGDVVLIQFGHNDSGALDDTARARGTIDGVGAETREIENPILKRHETVHTYGWYLRQYVEQAKAKGASVILCTLIPRKIWSDGHVARSGSDSYGGWAREVAEEEHVPLIDLNEIIAREYDALGQAAVEPLFADPHTHTSLKGARLNARAVVIGLKLSNADPLAKFFSPEAAAVPATMPPTSAAAIPSTMTP